MAPLLLGLSGPSSSGKTTLARLLRRILPFHTIILHQDDFYLPEAELPVREGLVDWDSAESLDLPYMVDCLKHVKATGQLPTSLKSKEDQNAVGPSGISEEEIEGLAEEVKKWAQGAGLSGKGSFKGKENVKQLPDHVSEGPKVDDTPTRRNEADIVIVDGFLLYGKSVPQLLSLFELRIMLRVTYAAAKARRESRMGYVTLEGFWEDPPGYVDKIVWPGYVEEHAYLFAGGDVEGEVDTEQARKLSISVCPGKGAWSLQQLLHWVLDEVKVGLIKRQKGEVL